VDSRHTAAAANSNLFSRKIDTWIEVFEDLRIYAKTAPGRKCAQRKAAELIVKVQTQSKESHLQNSVEELWL
jgi:hypothetical protein